MVLLLRQEEQSKVFTLLLNVLNIFIRGIIDMLLYATGGCK